MSGPREVPDLVRTLTLTDLVAYAGATWDWHRMHYDTEFARAKGLPGPVVDGQMLAALVAAQLQDAFGPAWRLTSLSFRFRRLVTAGRTVRCASVVTDEDEHAARVETTVHVREADGTEHVAMSPVSATLARTPQVRP